MRAARERTLPRQLKPDRSSGTAFLFRSTQSYVHPDQPVLETGMHCNQSNNVWTTNFRWGTLRSPISDLCCVSRRGEGKNVAKPKKRKKSKAAKTQATVGMIEAEEATNADVVNVPPGQQATTRPKKMKRQEYDQELVRLQVELVKMQGYIKEKGLKVVVIFEGRDTAGKGGTIKRIVDRLNPRIARVVALYTPTEREKTQWYFQRYVANLPAAGEMVLFDRSWYNRALVERVMGFCADEEYREFLRSCPEFERMLVRSGIVLIKYWLSVSDEEQERRFQKRNYDPVRRWKLSPMDLEARARWVEYSRAKDDMFKYTDIKQAPWFVVNADVKRHSRLNVIRHLLGMIPYEDLTPSPIELPPRQEETGYVRPPITDQTFIPEEYP
jgi:polyphosphate kinase